MARSRIAVFSFGFVWIVLVTIMWLLVGKDVGPNGLFEITVLAFLAFWGLYFWWSMASPKQKAKYFITTCVSTIVAVLAVEAVSLLLSIDYRQATGRPLDPWEKTINVLDRELIFIRKPRLRLHGKIHSGNLSSAAGRATTAIRRTYDLRYDQNGFRNDTDMTESDCIILGDSFVEGFHIHSDELHTTKIAEALDLRIANMGQSGYGPQQEMIVLNRFGLPLNPRLCLWVFYEGNDLLDIWRYQQLLDNWPTSVARYSSLKEKSFTKNLFWLIGAQIKPLFAKQDNRSTGLFQSGENLTRLWFGFDGHELSKSDLAALDTTVDLLGKAYSVCAEEEIQLIVVFAPTKYRVYADLCQFENTSRAKDWTVNDLPVRLAERIATISDDIGFLDLTPDLKRAARNGTLTYFVDDTHWSPEGHAVVASTICDYLREEYEHLLREQP